MSQPTIRIYTSKLPRELLERAYMELAEARAKTQGGESNDLVRNQAGTQRDERREGKLGAKFQYLLARE